MKSINIPNEELINLAQNHTINEIANLYLCSRSTISKKLQQLNIKARKPKKIVSEQGRKNISLAKIKFYKENPDKHNWKRNDKLKSVPCEKVKEWLKSKNIEFISDYNIPESDRNFAIDIAFPDKKIGIEINGNQHYNKDGTLADYYQKRHNHIENLGWKLYELHFSICFKIHEIENLIPTILNSINKVNFNYKIYIKPIKEKFCRKCKIKISNQSTHCKKCAPRKSKLKSHSIEELKEIVWQKPISHISKKMNCSDNGLIKFCLRNNIQLPPMGYWMRRRSGYSHEESLVSQKRIQKPAKRFTEEQVLEIKRLLSIGELSLREIGKQFNAHHTTIRNIKYGKTYI
jgi:hypothetical protein